MRTPSAAADSKDTRLSLGGDLIILFQRILQESADPETSVSSLLLAFAAEATINGQAAEVPDKALSEAK